jgi:N6-adenosine-specific RNA methylase IME4
MRKASADLFEGLPLLAGLPPRHFGCILADPPWLFKSYAPANANSTSRRDVEAHYKTMKLSDIQALPIRDLAHPDGCHLFLWATGPCLPQAIETIEAWGFRYSGVAFTWIKLKKSCASNQFRVTPVDSDFHVGLGFTTRKNAEFCLLARRGNARRIAKDVRELIIAPRREHSRKPDEAHERIERYAAGPYLELFGRQQRPNWTVRGDEAGKFNTVDDPIDSGLETQTARRR